MMSRRSRPTVGPWQLDTLTRTLTDGHETRKLTGTGVRVLELLMERAPSPVSKDELMELVWEGKIVGDNTLHQNVSMIRRALRHPKLKSDCIKNIAGFGYQLLTSTSHPSQQFPVLAVLPFSEASDVASPVAFGLSMEIHGALTCLSQLRVVPMLLTRTCSSEEKQLHAVRERFNARYLLGGSVRGHGKQLRVAVELSDALTEKLLWKKTYVGGAEGVLDYQVAIAEAVAQRVGLEVSRAEYQQLEARSVAEFGAFELSARAIDLFWNLSGPHYGRRDMASAVALARRALELDPHYARGQALLSQLLYQHAVQMAYAGFEQDVLHCASLANRAITYAPAQAEVLYHAGWVLAHIPESRERGLSASERAVELAPNDAWALAQLGSLYVRAGRLEEGEAIADAQLAEGLHLDDWNQMARMTAATLRGNFHAAVDIGAPYVETHPTFIWYRMLLGNAYGALGKHGLARSQVEEAARYSARFTPVHWKWIQNRHIWNCSEACYGGLEAAGLL